MSTPAPEVDIPEASVMRLVCYPCLSGQWVGPARMMVEVTKADGTTEEVEREIGEWHCGDCGSHKALLISSIELDRRLAEREAAG